MVLGTMMGVHMPVQGVEVLYFLAQILQENMLVVLDVWPGDFDSLSDSFCPLILNIGQIGVVLGFSGVAL